MTTTNRFYPVLLSALAILPLAACGPCPRATIRAQAPLPPAPVVVAEPEFVEEWVRVDHKITFESNSDVLTREGESAILQAASELRGRDVVAARLEGHTNGERQTARSEELSKERADVVRARLVSLGFDANLFETRAVGAVQPIAEAGAGERNRRVELHVLVRRQVGEGSEFGTPSPDAPQYSSIVDR